MRGASDCTLPLNRASHPHPIECSAYRLRAQMKRGYAEEGTSRWAMVRRRIDGMEKTVPENPS